MRARGPVAILASVLLAFANVTHAATDGRLAGMVTGKDGTPLVGVGVEVVNLNSGQSATAKTDGTGAFEITLAAGSYSLKPASSEPYDIVRAPKAVVIAPDDTAHAELVLAKRDLPPAALAGTDGAVAAPAAAAAGGGLSAAAIAGLAAVGVFATAAILVTRNSGPSSQSPSR